MFDISYYLNFAADNIHDPIFLLFKICKNTENTIVKIDDILEKITSIQQKDIKLVSLVFDFEDLTDYVIDDSFGEKFNVILSSLDRMFSFEKKPSLSIENRFNFDPLLKSFVELHDDPYEMFNDKNDDFIKSYIDNPYKYEIINQALLLSFKRLSDKFDSILYQDKKEVTGTFGIIKRLSEMLKQFHSDSKSSDLEKIQSIDLIYEEIIKLGLNITDNLYDDYRNLFKENYTKYQLASVLNALRCHLKFFEVNLSKKFTDVEKIKAFKKVLASSVLEIISSDSNQKMNFNLQEFKKNCRNNN